MNDSLPLPTTYPEDSAVTGMAHKSRLLAAGLWPYLLAAVMVTLLRVPTLTNRILSIDEASYLVHALRLRSLEAFVFAFVYRAETKTQLGLVPYMLANALDRSNALLLVHVFGLVAAIVGCVLIIKIAWRFAGALLAGLAASAVWAIYLVVGPGYPQPANLDGYTFFQAPRLEYFQTPFLLAAVYWFLFGCEVEAYPDSRRRATNLLFLAGLCWSIAALIKPSAALFGLPLLFALPLLITTGRRLTGALRRGGAMLAGAALPVVLVFAPYLFHPSGIEALRFSFTELSSQYAEKGDHKARVLELLTGLSPMFLAAFVLTLGVALVGTFVYRRHTDLLMSFRLPALMGMLAIALFVGMVPGQGHVYYLVPAVPFMALTITCTLASVIRRLASRRGRGLAWGAALLIAVTYLGTNIEALIKYPEQTLHDAYLARDRRRFNLDGLVAYIKSTTPHDGTMWVYYNTPELFVLSERLPVTLDPAGIWLDYIWSEPWFQRIAADLAAERPHLIIGINRPRYHYPHTSPLLEVPVVGDWIKRNYICDAHLIRGVVVCKRPDLGRP
jgi:hypothetical protein